MSKTLKVVFTNTTIGEIEIDKKQVQTCLQAVSWPAMTPEEIAYILTKNPVAWCPENAYIPKSSLNLPLLDMPMIYFTRFESSSVVGNELTLRFFGPSIGGWHLYAKNPVMYAWDNTQEVVSFNRIQELSPNIVNKIPASENFTAIEWLDRFVNDVPMPEQEMTTERLEAVWDIVMWKNYHNYTTRVNNRISTTLSNFYGFEDLGADELQNNMQANFRNFWDRFNAKVRENRYYSMGIMTIPLKRSNKRKRNGSKTLPPLPIIPVEVRKLIDSYIFS